MTTVTFALSLPGDTRSLPEAELGDASARIDEDVDFENVDGALTVATGAAELVVEDELSAAVSGLCFEAVTRLLDTPELPYAYRCAYQTAHVVLVPMMDTIRLFGEGTPVVDAPRRELLPAMYDCGMRYVRFLSGRDDHWAGYVVETLRSRAEVTAEALARHGLGPDR
ncbi:hypothetical protein LX16_5354 [Stackebrandtia albiflava]|uniref:Uncharacterized protein n=1 Tax=Stackebrandtia albiflava TaxID=406432 RepID=A0A562ULA9_9ACTN|nr:hypothetical protein [Stackebrandtia albiflava]TWJ06390.1 hypothetical protein LX16_5354 [Stackebrandtia albiflava]